MKGGGMEDAGRMRIRKWDGGGLARRWARRATTHHRVTNLVVVPSINLNLKA